MKKLLTGILTMIYMTVSSGVVAEIHYCMGKRAGIDFYGTGSDKCGKCGMKDTRTGCCHDEHKFYKLADSHKNVYNDISFTTPDKIVVTTYPLYDWQLSSDAITAAVNNHSPPDPGGPSVTVLNCVFRL